MSLPDALNQLTQLLKGIPGLRAVYPLPPETLANYPAAFAYPPSGQADIGPVGVARLLTNLVIEVHLCRRDSPRDIARLVPLISDITDELLNDPTLGGSVSTFSSVLFTFGAMNWGGVDTIGIRFTLQNVKIQEIL